MSSPPAVSQRSVTARGIRVHYQVAGSGQPVVLLHGWPVSSTLWRHQILGLAGQMQVYAIDLPGFGRSDRPEPALGLDSFAEVLLEFLEEVDLERTSLVAHDLGGPIALLAAAEQPSRFERLAILNTTPYPELPWAIRALVSMTRTPLVGRLVVSPLGFRAMFHVGTAGRHTDSGALAEEHWRNVAGKQGRRSLRAVLAATSPEPLARLEGRLNAISCPALVLWAERDRTAPLGIARRLAGDLPNATLQTIPDAGHFLPQDAPGPVTERLIGFLVDSS